MRELVEIDDELLLLAMEVTGESDINVLVNMGLRALVSDSQDEGIKEAKDTGS